MKCAVLTLTAGLLGIAIGVAISIPPAYAATKSKVDCVAVMKERSGGKKAKEIAKEMSISVSSVYRCKRRQSATKAASKAGNEAATKPAASTAAASKP